MRCILFDWGDTLMQVFPQYSGAMVDWPQVAEVPGAREALARLHPTYRLAVATNAQDSDEAEIWAALKRVGLDEFLDKVYCFRSVGFRKPSPEFFAKILQDQNLPAQDVVMVGDDWQADILGANQAGLRAVWLNARSPEQPSGELYRTIHTLAELPECLDDWGEKTIIIRRFKP